MRKKERRKKRRRGKGEGERAKEKREMGKNKAPATGGALMSINSTHLIVISAYIPRRK